MTPTAKRRIDELERLVSQGIAIEHKLRGDLLRAEAENAALRELLDRAKAFIDPHALRIIKEIERLIAAKEPPC